ncbi:MAG: hypothetical protein AB7Q42_23985 [Acidimicrobiia bacterium]
MDLRTWITTDLAAVRTRFHSGIAAHVPTERWTTRLTAAADTGPANDTNARPSSSISWLLFHLSYHHDLAVNTAVLGHRPLLADRRGPLGIAGAAAEAGLPEREDPEISAALDATALVDYADTVIERSLAWMDRVAITAFDSIPDASWRIEEEAGVRRDAVPWLHDMWTGKPVWWFVQWEAVGHGHTHVGEMTGLRGQLGHSPF